MNTRCLPPKSVGCYNCSMIQVDFSEEERIRSDVSGSGTVGGIAGLLIHIGFAGDEKQANQVLVMVFIGILIITVILAWLNL